MHFKSGKRAGRCVEVVMLQEPWLVAVSMERPNDSLRRRLQLRVAQGQQSRDSITPCPICHGHSVTRIAVSRFGNPVFATDRTACSFHTESQIMFHAAGQIERYLPVEIFPISWRSILSICKYLGLRGEKMITVTDFILDLCGFPPTCIITPEDAVRFFNNEPPSRL